MKQIATYRKAGGGEIRIEYDDEAPCKCCGEPVIGASMGGTDLCGPCDMGKCRYCGMTIFVLKEKVDGGRSLKDLRDHMKWHRVHDPSIPEQIQMALKAHRALAKELEEEDRERKKNLLNTHYCGRPVVHTHFVPKTEFSTGVVGCCGEKGCCPDK